jgi:hypothetical protein
MTPWPRDPAGNGRMSGFSDNLRSIWNTQLNARGLG